MSAAWVVRDAGEVEAAFAREGEAIDYRQRYGAADMTITCETLLTPESRAVILEAARDIEYMVNAEYHGPDDVHPAMRAKYTRDMAIVGQLRAIVLDALRAHEDS